MAAFQVSSSELKAKANELRDLNGQFKSQIGELETKEVSLVSKYKGASSDAFDARFKEEKNQMDNFCNLIEQYCVALDNIAAEYYKAEMQAVAIAQSRA